MESEKITMQGVKFHASMQEVVPVIKMSTLLNIAEGLKCRSTMEVFNLINACYGPITLPSIDGAETKEVKGLVDQIAFFNVAVEIIYQSAATACENAGREPDFNRAVIRGIITQSLAASIITWFFQECKLLTEAEQTSGNEPATIRITC